MNQNNLKKLVAVFIATVLYCLAMMWVCVGVELEPHDKIGLLFGWVATCAFTILAQSETI